MNEWRNNALIFVIRIVNQFKYLFWKNKECWIILKKE